MREKEIEGERERTRGERVFEIDDYIFYLKLKITKNYDLIFPEKVRQFGN